MKGKGREWRWEEGRANERKAGGFNRLQHNYIQIHILRAMFFSY